MNKQLKSKSDRFIKENDWSKYLNDQALTERERFDMVQIKAKQLEEKAKLDEQLAQMDEADPEVIEQVLAVNDLYIESIKAKL